MLYLIGDGVEADDPSGVLKPFSASDSSANRSIVRMKANADKQKVVSKHVVMAYSGEPGATSSTPSCANRELMRPLAWLSMITSLGDTVQFAEYVERNLRLYGIR
jgi:20S proteasome subunit beta 4